MIVLSNATGLGVCIIDACPKPHEVDFGNKNFNWHIFPINVPLSGFHWRSMLGRVCVWKVPGSRGNDTLDGRREGDFCLKTLKTLWRTGCVHEHFERKRWKAKHLTHSEWILIRANVGAKMVGAVCQAAPDVLNNRRKLPVRRAR